MFAILLLAYVVNAMNKMIFPVLIGDVRTNYGFSLQQAGLQSTIFALGVGLAGIPGGYLVARLRRKTVVVLGTLVFSAATALTAFAFGFWDMLLWQTVAGVGESLQLTALIAIAAAAFPRTPSAAIGSINVAFGIGAIVGPALGGSMLSSFGTWRAPMITLAVAGFAAALAVAALVRIRFTDSVTSVTSVTAPPTTRSGMVNRNTMVMVALCALGGLITYGYIGMYPSFLQVHLRYSPAHAGVVMGLSGVGALFSAFGGLLGDKLNPRLVMISSYLLTAVAGAALFAGPDSYAWQLTWSLVLGLVFNAIVFVNLSSILIKCVRPSLSGEASGLFVTALFVPAAFAGYVFSWLVQVSGWTAAGLIQIAVGSLLAAALATLLRPTDMPSAVEPAVTNEPPAVAGAQL
jgi:predicted MFS family arabinose efflux permease